MFPTSIDGTVELSGSEAAPAEAVLSNVERELALASACDIRRRDTKITFRGGAFRMVSNRNVLSIIGAGEITIDSNLPSQLRYSFSCVEFFVFVTMMAGFVGMFSVGRYPTYAPSYALPFGMWLLVFGGNYLIALARVQTLVKHAVHD